MSIALSASGAPAQDDPDEAAQKGREAFLAFHDYYIRDGGSWRTENPDFEAGGDMARQFGLDFAYDLGRWIATTRIYGIMENGKGVEYWRVVDAWDASTRRIVAYQFGLGGAVLSGTAVKRDDGTDEIVMDGHAWDGSPFAYRDVIRFLGPDTMEIEAFRKNEAGGWEPFQTNVWTRMRESGRE